MKEIILGMFIIFSVWFLLALWIALLWGARPDFAEKNAPIPLLKSLLALIHLFLVSFGLGISTFFMRLLNNGFY